MKQFIVLLLIALLVPAFLFAQEEEYKSKEQEEFYKNREFKEFKPLDRVVFLNYKDDFFEFDETVDYSPYYDTLYLTPFQDSISRHCFDYLWDESLRQSIGGIDRYQILKYEKKDNAEAFVYYDRRYVRKFCGEPELWVAYSSNEGETWEYYYTGIVQRQPIFVKWYSKLPLFNSEGGLQIEACLLRQMSSYIMPVGFPEFQLQKDGLVLTLDLETLQKDSDGDGLTDIVEAKFQTDPNNADTDGDGIPDDLDLNPRFSLPRTEKTVIMESVIENKILDFFTDTLSILNIPEPSFATDTTETVLIVTDSPDIMSIQPKSCRVIILTEEEYEVLKEPFEDDLPRTYITPLFKVDDIPDAFVFSVNYGMSGKSYFVVKKENTWVLEVTSAMII